MSEELVQPWREGEPENCLSKFAIRKHSNLPLRLYRVQWHGCLTTPSPEGHLLAADPIRAADAAWQQSMKLCNQVRPKTETVKTRAPAPGETPSDRKPFIPLFSSKRGAKAWAFEQSKRVGRNCSISVIDTQAFAQEAVFMLYKTFLKVHGDFKKGFGCRSCGELIEGSVDVDVDYSDPVKTYLVWNRIPKDAIGRTFEWGCHPRAKHACFSMNGRTWCRGQYMYEVPLDESDYEVEREQNLA